MKKNLLILAILGCFFSSIAQVESDHKGDKKVETITTEITTKSTTVNTKATTDVKTVTETISLKNKKEPINMSIERNTETSHSKKVISTNAQVNKENEADLKILKQKQRDELKASKKAEMAKAAKKKQEMDNKEKQRLAELESDRKNLEKRSKGMAKLKKDN
jgi:hypothetical protein